VIDVYSQLVLSSSYQDRWTFAHVMVNCHGRQCDAAELILSHRQPWYSLPVCYSDAVAKKIKQQ